MDYGAQNLVLASLIVNSIPGHMREVVLLDYQVVPGVGGEFIDDKILADICRQNRDLESEVNYFKNLGYLYLIREKREELAEKGELSSKWQMFDSQAFQYKLNLERLQDMGKELYSRALQSFQEFLNRDRNKNPDIVIFTGGMSSFPGVKNCLEGSVDLLKVKHVDSRGAIAQGALQLGLNLDPELTYRKDFSIGVGLSFGKFFPLLDLSKLPQDEGEELNYRKILNLKAEEFPQTGVELGVFLGLSQSNTGNMPLARQVIAAKEIRKEMPVCLDFNLRIRKTRGEYTGFIRVCPKEVLDKGEETKFIFYV